MATPNVSSFASYPQTTAELSQRVALYGRVSTKDKGQEVQNQLRQLREFAAHSGWTIVAEYIDHESGKGSAICTALHSPKAAAHNPFTIWCVRPFFVRFSTSPRR